MEFHYATVAKFPLHLQSYITLVNLCFTLLELHHITLAELCHVTKVDLHYIQVEQLH